MLRRNYYSNRAYFNTNSTPADITNQRVTDPAIGTRLTVLLGNPNLTQKDREFVVSLDSTWKRFSNMSANQYKYFEIVENRYNPAVIAQTQADRAAWVNSWDDWKKLQFKLCCKYYSHTSYFRDLATKGLTDPSFIPTEKQYRAMCENNYAKRLIENMTTNEFDVNDLVQFRRNRKESDPVGVVLAVLDDITSSSAVVGGRYYKIMMMVSGVEVLAQQREIKSYRNK